MTASRYTCWSVTALGVCLVAGCGPGVRLQVTQPEQAPPQDRLSLTGKWAFFDSAEDGDRILLALAHPGAWDGKRQYFLYLRVPPGKGEFTIGGSPGEDPGTRRCRGFYIQRSGRLAGLAEFVAGELKLGGLPFDGGKKRTGRMHLECNDGGIREITVSHKRQVSDLPKRPDA